MNTTVIFTTNEKEKCKYIYDINRKEYYFAHPLLLYYYNLDVVNELYKNEESLPEIVDCDNNKYDHSDDITYYYKKYLFLKAQNFFSTKNFKEQLQGELNEISVEKTLRNLNNIVFEVTDACNLNCKYCGYGEMYYDHDERKNSFLSMKSIEATISFLRPYLDDSASLLYIGFYGGEPLLNIKVIRDAIAYINKQLSNRKVIYTMTTNGVLLDKYIDFLFKNKFKLTVSIDGDEFNQSYRVFHSGKNSFEVVYNNLKLIKSRYPEFFEKNVNFNTVIHSRNTVKQAHSFLLKEFGKNTRLSPLDDAGIRKEKQEEFRLMYNNIYDELSKIDNVEKMISERFIDDPNVFRLAFFLKTRLANTKLDKYEELLDEENNVKVPGGACLPFQKKIFVTVNGKILPCERINQDYQLGKVTEGKVVVDFREIAATYNNYYKNIKNQCYNCYNAEACSQCFFQIDNLCKHYKCHGFSNIHVFSKTLSEIISFLEKNPKLFHKIVNEVVIK